MSAMLQPASDDRFDQELARWFADHGGTWSGTASELLAALETRGEVGSDWWPQSSRALYSHVESHRQMLRSLGMDVMLHEGYPRMVTLRSSHDEPVKTPSPVKSGINPTSDPPASAPSLIDQNKSPASSGEVNPAAHETVSQDMTRAKSDFAERFVPGKYANGDHFQGRVFKNTGEALFAIVEMRVRVREQGLDLKSTIDLVVERTQEITRSSGVLVGLLQQDSVVYTARTGIASTMAGLRCHETLFQSCLKAGEAINLADAREHPLVGATCRREGIGSLIMVPIFHNREVAGAIELLFTARRPFSTYDVIDLELLACVISERLSGIEPMGFKQADGRECPAKSKAVENIESQLRDSLNEKAGLVHLLASSSPDITHAQPSSTTSAAPESVCLASKLATAPSPFWDAFKRTWMRCARVMGIRSSGPSDGRD